MGVRMMGRGGGILGWGRVVWRMGMIMFVMGRFIGLRRGMMRICEWTLLLWVRYGGFEGAEGLGHGG
jgi:hypothetical protein